MPNSRDTRRPPQKGIERFRSISAEEEVAHARTSVRRWWWEYLRLSKDYWLVCKTSANEKTARTTDKKLARIYGEFGNVHDSSFEEWWVKRGAKVFQEQYEPPKVRAIRDYSDVSENRDRKLLIEIPLVLTRRTITNQINRLLDAPEFESQRLSNRLEMSQSDFPINPVPYRLLVLKQMHEVYCLHRDRIAKPAALRTISSAPVDRLFWQQEYEQRPDLYSIGKQLHISRANERLIGTEQEINAKKNAMRATVSRFLGQAKKLIANVEYGAFPAYTDQNQPEQRFTATQLRRHADLEEEWWSLNLNSQLSEGQ